MKHFIMIGGFFFTRYKYLRVWEEMELRIRIKHYWECFFLTLLPAMILSIMYSWWWMLVPFITYNALYWLEKLFRLRSVFDWEATEYCGDTLYFRKRKSYAWMKWYGKKNLPLSEWDDRNIYGKSK